LFVIVYDEHGGFYDHVMPGSAVDDDPEFRRLGVRVPALIVSPLVASASTSTTALGEGFHFDHTSIIKTILARFCATNGEIPAMTARVEAANHLGHLLADGPARQEASDYTAVAAQLTEWQAEWSRARFSDPVAKARPPARLTDFQTGFYDMARRLREAGLPGGHP
jgi:phospholipase C